MNITQLCSVEHNFIQQNSVVAGVQTVMETDRQHVHMHVIIMLWMDQTAPLSNRDEGRYHVYNLEGETFHYFMSWE